MPIRPCPLFAITSLVAFVACGDRTELPAGGFMFTVDDADAAIDAAPSLDAGARRAPDATADVAAKGTQLATTVQHYFAPPSLSPDASTCVNVDLATYDRSCTIDSDCMGVAGGTICSSDCGSQCPSSAINVDGQARYRQTLQQLVPFGICGCGEIPAPDAYCKQGVCTYVVPAPPH